MNTRSLLPMNPWLWSHTLGETYAAGFDPLGVGAVQRDARLALLLRTALSDSPFYRRRLGHAGAVPRLEQFEPVSKAELMHHFDDWATDREITRASVEAFVHDTRRVGDPYLGRYLVWTSSGTTGQPGIFVQDALSLAVFDALDSLRLQHLGSPAQPWPMWGQQQQRFAFVAATGGHFAGVVSFERLRRSAAAAPLPLQWLAPQLQTFSVLQPLETLEAELTAFAPTVLVTYPSCADALALAQAEGRLALSPRQVWVGGEQLSAEQRQRIRNAFGCTLRNNYGASEFYAIAWECGEGVLHLNHDWVILEAVDEHDRAVPAGEASHSVLLTNLANRTQPLIRYRLGDSVRFLVDPCACGSAFPAIEIHGRADHTLRLRDAHGREVPLLPLALSTVIEEGAGVTQFQLLCLSPTRLELRFEAEVAAPSAAFERIKKVLAEYLATHGLSRVTIVHGKTPPVRHPRSGKLERVRLGESFNRAAR